MYHPHRFTSSDGRSCCVMFAATDGKVLIRTDVFMKLIRWCKCLEKRSAGASYRYGGCDFSENITEDVCRKYNIYLYRGGSYLSYKKFLKLFAEYACQYSILWEFIPWVHKTVEKINRGIV